MGWMNSKGGDLAIMVKLMRLYIGDVWLVCGGYLARDRVNGVAGGVVGGPGSTV